VRLHPQRQVGRLLGSPAAPLAALWPGALCRLGQHGVEAEEAPGEADISATADTATSWTWDRTTKREEGGKTGGGGSGIAKS